MDKLDRSTVHKPPFPVKVIQFGGGNFLRGFVDYLLDVYNYKMNEQLGVAVVKVTPGGDYSEWKAQDGLYHVLTKGIHNGERINENRLVSSVSEIIHAYKEWNSFLSTAENPDIQFVFSNTTESGLRLSEKDKMTDAPPFSFPAKLTKWLYHRFLYFQGEKNKGCKLIPCELLEDNGQILKDLILECAQNWKLGAPFTQWIENENEFYNTLVDRIVPGVHKERMEETWKEIGYEDYLVTEGEPYHLWVLEGPETLGEILPLDKAGLNIVFTKNLKPYRARKVRILNGAHTALVPVGYLAGIRIVRDAVEDPICGRFLRRLLHEEILPTLSMPENELQAYSSTVMDRFKNPNIDHYLISIALNSFSKFKVRLLPSLVEYINQKEKAPPLLSFSFVCLLLFYRGEENGETITLKDDPIVLEKMAKVWAENKSPGNIVAEILSWESFWGADLKKLPGLENTMTSYLKEILEKGVNSVLSTISSSRY